MEKELFVKSIGLSIEAIALSKAIRDLVLTDEQRKQIPELFNKYFAMEVKQTCDLLEIEPGSIPEALNL
ncbi:MAG: hypothetical protein WCL00_05520 [Bacteroidota bacterium]